MSLSELRLALEISLVLWGMIFCVAFKLIQ